MVRNRLVGRNTVSIEPFRHAEGNSGYKLVLARPESLLNLATPLR